MRNSFIAFILILFLSILIFDGCKKRFPDGPRISFRGIDERVSNLWTLQNYIVDGIDSAEIINNVLGAKCKIHFYCFCGHDNAAYDIRWGNDTSNYYYANYAYEYNSIGGGVGLTLEGIFGQTPVIGHIPLNQFIVFEDTARSSRNYKVLRCTVKELWLKTISHNRTYELHLN